MLIATSLGGNEATGRLALAYGPTEDLVDRRMLKYACEALYKSIKQIGLDLIFRLASRDFTLMIRRSEQRNHCLSVYEVLGATASSTRAHDYHHLSVLELLANRVAQGCGGADVAV